MTLVRLIAKINDLAPLECKKNQDEKAMIRFLRETVVGTEWGLRVSSWVTRNPLFRTGSKSSAHQTTTSRGTFKKYPGTVRTRQECSKRHHEGRTAEEISAWMPSRTYCSQGKDGTNEMLISKNEQKQEHKKKSAGNFKASTKRFNCEREYCDVRKCTIPRDGERISRNLAEWRRQKGYKEKKICVAEIMCLSVQ